MNETGTKHDEGKPDYSLLPLRFIKPLVPVFKVGEERYGYENWKKPFDNRRRRFIAAIKRHLEEAEEDPLAVNEQDGGVYHLAQVAWNALLLLWHEMREAKKQPTIK